MTQVLVFVATLTGLSVVCLLAFQSCNKPGDVSAAWAINVVTMLNAALFVGAVGNLMVVR